MYCYALCAITTDRDGLLQSHEVDSHFRSLYKSHTHGLHNHMDYCTCTNAYNAHNIAQIILNTAVWWYQYGSKRNVGFLCHVVWLAHPLLLWKQQGHLTSHHAEMICGRVDIQGFSYIHGHMKMNSIPVSLTPVLRSSQSVLCHQTLSSWEDWICAWD